MKPCCSYAKDDSGNRVLNVLKVGEGEGEDLVSIECVLEENRLAIYAPPTYQDSALLKA